jgi:hypothetical protein
MYMDCTSMTQAEKMKRLSLSESVEMGTVSADPFSRCNSPVTRDFLLREDDDE